MLLHLNPLAIQGASHWNTAVVGPCASKGASVGVRHESRDPEPLDRPEGPWRLAVPGVDPGRLGASPQIGVSPKRIHDRPMASSLLWSGEVTSSKDPPATKLSVLDPCRLGRLPGRHAE